LPPSLAVVPEKMQKSLKILTKESFWVAQASGTQIFQRSTRHLKILGTRREKGHIQQVPFWKPTNIRHHCTKCRCPGWNGV
jgi:hypothetical protein